MKRINFCPSCGSNDFYQKEIKAWHCQKCEFIYFHNTAAAVVAILMYENEILLTIRKNDPCKGMYDLPGGFVDYHETLEAALTREIREELNLDIEDWKYGFSYANRYEYEGITYHTTDAFFVITLDEKPAIEAGCDVADVAWRAIEDIDLKKVGFISVRQAIQYIQRMKRDTNGLLWINHETN